MDVSVVDFSAVAGALGALDVVAVPLGADADSAVSEVQPAQVRAIRQSSPATGFREFLTVLTGKMNHSRLWFMCAS